MAITAPSQYSLGGVDTRSNPVNRPSTRALRCRDFIPDEAGFLRLRYGYGAVTMSAVVASAIHSMWEYKLWDGTRYLVFVQGTSLKRMAMATGTVTTLGALTSSAQCSFDYSDNKLWIVNGTDCKFYDGTTLRDIGIAAATAAQVASVTITEALREFIAAEGTATTVGQNAAGGAFTATTSSGYLVYGHYIDMTAGAGWGHGPGRLLGTGARVTFAAGATNKFVLTVLPTTYTGRKKIYSISGDGTSISKFCSVGSKAITNLSFNASTGLMTVTAVAHGFSVGDVIENSATGWEFVGVIASVPDANTFTYYDLVHRNSGTTGAVTATAYKLLVTDLATAAQDITVTTTGVLQANGDVGLAASTVTSAAPGYLIYASMYNPTTDHPGNRVVIQGRILQTSYRAIYYIQGMADLSAVDSEFRWLFGRTGDGSEVPYVMADSAVNWQYIDNARTSFVIRESAIDGGSELPNQNDKPSGLKLIKRVGSRMYAVKASSPYAFFTPDKGDKSVVGKAEQIWFADDFDTFPTGENIIAIDEHDQSLAAFSANNGALLVDLSGVLGWSNTTAVGIAGQRAFTSTPYGDFWVSGEKQLIKIGPDGPIVVSDEYEKGTLSRIGSSYLSTTELAYLKDATRGLDRLIVNCKDSTGTPFQVYHDFKLRDGRSPEGQGYESVFLSALASSFTMKQVRDANGLMKIWCGGSVGQIYELETGANDNGTEFVAEYITLVNLGEDKKSNPWDSWFGDAQLKVYQGSTLNTTLAQMQDEVKRLGEQKVPGGKDNFKWAVARKADSVEAPQYIRFSLTSHPNDALVDGVASPTNPMALNTVPHLPLEDYGRVYSVKIALTESRGE